MFIAGIWIGFGLFAAYLLIRAIDLILGLAIFTVLDRMEKHGPIQRRTVRAWLISCGVLLGIPVSLTVLQGLLTALKGLGL